MQSRDFVEAHRLVFSAKLYDDQGPIARGGSYQPPPPPPLTVRVMRNALTGRGLRHLYAPETIRKDTQVTHDKYLCRVCPAASRGTLNSEQWSQCEQPNRVAGLECRIYRLCPEPLGAIRDVVVASEALPVYRHGVVFCSFFFRLHCVCWWAGREAVG